MKHYTNEELIDYLHGEAFDGDDARMHAHLAACDECSARYDAEAALGDLLRAAARADEREFPSLVKARVWAAIRDRQPTFLERVRTFARPAIAVPVAAGLALAAYLGVPVLRSNATGTPTVAAAFYLEEHAAEAQLNPLSDHSSVTASLYAERSAPASAALIDSADAATLSDDVAPPAR